MVSLLNLDSCSKILWCFWSIPGIDNMMEVLSFPKPIPLSWLSLLNYLHLTSWGNWMWMMCDSILYPRRHLFTDLWTKTATIIQDVGKTVGSGRICIVLCSCFVLYPNENSKTFSFCKGENPWLASVWDYAEWIIYFKFMSVSFFFLMTTFRLRLLKGKTLMKLKKMPWTIK